MPNIVPPGVRAIVFDAVGTLIHPAPSAAEVYAAVGHRFGSRYDAAAIAERFSAAFRRQEQLDRVAGWRTSEMRERERWRAIVHDVLDDVIDTEACFLELFEHFARPSSWRWTVDVLSVFNRLEAKYQVAIASNYDGRLRSVVGDQPNVPLFISAEIGWRKPAGQFFDAICDGLGFSAGQLLYVGDDQVNDYEGARSAGMHSVLFDARTPLADLLCE